jgi:hypothetical protein
MFQNQNSYLSSTFGGAVCVTEPPLAIVTGSEEISVPVGNTLYLIVTCPAAHAALALKRAAARTNAANEAECRMVIFFPPVFGILIRLPIANRSLPSIEILA